jgi:amino acid adenylation domain-containing protein
MPKMSGTNSEIRLQPVSWRVHELFEQQVAERPEAVAIESTSTAWTYLKLESCSNQIANRLRKLGVARGSLVGACVSRSPSAIAAFLGILKTGGAFVPIDADFPLESIRFMVRDTQLKHFVVDSAGADKLGGIPDDGRFFLHIDQIAGESCEAPDVPGSASDLAYVMYTSGSSGAPKGIMIEHRGIVRLVSQPNYASLSPDETILQLAPLSFDASTFEIWGALANGAKLVIAPGEKPSLSDIAACLRQSRVTTLWLTSGLLNAMVNEHPEVFRGVRQLLAGGDVLSPHHIRRAIEAIGSGCVINGYGPTENTTFTCCHRVRIEDTKTPSIPIGVPINGTKIYLLNGDLQPLPPGETGEICIGGEGLARGYWNRPDLTAEKFIDYQFSDGGSARLYRSGDLGHYNARGELEFDGRLDLQVKVRGFRIEPAEIEFIVNAFSGIASSAVVAKQSASGDKRLACYFVPKAGVQVSAVDLESFARERLPGYSIPSEFIELERIPLNENGKVDRKLLAQLESKPPAPHANAPEASDQLELELIRMVKQLLRVPHVALDDDFFKLGGDSLLAAQFFSRIESRFGKKLPLATMLEARSIRRLAEVIRDNNWVAPWSSLVPLKASGARPPLFLVHPIGGNVLTYSDLADGLPADQPLYALQAAGLDGESPAASSLEEMASHYVRAIRTRQEHGPYYLGGFSAGGIVALEMARQLERAGDKIALLAVFETDIDPPVRALLRRNQFVESYQRLARIAQWNLNYLRRTGIRDFSQKKWRNSKMNMSITAFEALTRLKSRTGTRWAAPPRLSVEEAFLYAISKYEAGIFSGYTVLFKTHDFDSYCADPMLGWKAIATGDLEVRQVPGDHDTMLRSPQLESLIDQLTAVLDEARVKMASTVPAVLQ